MNGKRYLLIMALALVVALIGGAIFNRLLAPASAQQNDPGQQWEYCALAKAAYVGSNRGDIYWISYFRDSGVQVVEVEDTALERMDQEKESQSLERRVGRWLGKDHLKSDRESSMRSISSAQSGDDRGHRLIL